MDIIENDEEIRPGTHYQESDFQNLSFILKYVNHNVWFGISSLHKNTIESLWHQIKSINNIT